MQVASGYGSLVVLTVFVASFDASVSIAKQNLHSFPPTQVLLIRAFDAKLAYVVARLIVVVVLHIALRHLGNIAKHMGSDGRLVLPDAATLDIETRKSIHLFLKDRELLVRELAHEELLGEA